MKTLLAPYELLDYGAGRRLERLGRFVVDRPALGTEDVKRARPELWRDTDARYDGARATAGEWSIRNPELAALAKSQQADGRCFWTLDAAEFSLGLRLSPSGQVGVFPEQAENWNWIAGQVRAAREELGSRPRVLNLFAYTGGSTLAAAAAGAEVTHVDASQSVVNWARENAALSQLTDAPIRWLVEDAFKFVQRELRRGNTYHAVIMDPPSYGHGRGKSVWKIENDLTPLLADCFELTQGQLHFLLLTAHTPEFRAARLREFLQENITADAVRDIAINAGELAITTSQDRRLAAGHFARLATKP